MFRSFVLLQRLRLLWCDVGGSGWRRRRWWCGEAEATCNHDIYKNKHRQPRRPLLPPPLLLLLLLSVAHESPLSSLLWSAIVPHLTSHTCMCGCAGFVCGGGYYELDLKLVVVTSGKSYYFALNLNIVNCWSCVFCVHSVLRILLLLLLLFLLLFF